MILAQPPLSLPLIPPAGDLLPVHLEKRRVLLLTDLAHLGKAPGMERAAGRWVDRAGDVAGQDDPLGAFGLAHPWNGRQERLSVRVQRVIEQVVGPTQFHDVPEVHHRHPVADVVDHTQIVRDEQVGQVELFLQFFEQVDHLGLDRDIQ